ncbi:retrovirus-related pol polyprotein from transposon TNT 1-94 [Tanacetum coccineum]
MKSQFLLSKVPSPPLTQESESMDITLTLSPITPLYIQFNTPSPPSPLFGHPIPWNLLEAYGATCLCFRNHELESFCDEKGIYQNFSFPYTPEQNGATKRKNRTLIEAARTMLNGLVLSKHFWTKAVRISYALCLFINTRSSRTNLMLSADDMIASLGIYFVSKAFRVFNTRRKQVEETYHVTFDESIEAIRFTNTLEDEIGIDDSSRYPSNKFIHEDDPSRQYQTDSDISYYVILHGRSLSELTQENHVLEVIALNEPDKPLSEDTEDSPNLINTKGTHEQNNKNEQIITQPTKGPSGKNTEVSVSINESLVLDVPQSHISNQASISSHPIPQDRWSKDQHIKLMNIIGDPGEGMLAKSMAAKLTAVSASECLFAGFLFEIEPKKVSEALKHLGWVDAMQEELNQFYRNKVWTLVPLPLVAQGYSQEEGIDYDETFAPVTRMKAISIFLAFDTYMNFKVYQIDVKSAFINGKLKEEVYVKQPPGFESSEFPNYVYKLDKAIYGLKQAPRVCSLVKTPMVPPNNLGLDLAVLCVRYQSNLKESHLTVVKRILRYLKGTPTLGLYYLKCSGFDLKGYSDSDYAGCNMDKKITTGACEILCGKLVCWSAKKQQSVVISSAKVEYVVAVRDHILKGDNELHFIPTEYCHTPKWGLDGIRVRRRDVITYTAQDQVNDHYTLDINEIVLTEA